VFIRVHLLAIHRSSCLNSGVDDEPIELPIDGMLDLHTFQPREIKDLVPDYLAECQQRGILRVRIIHGKGIGNLRRTVHSILEKHPQVAEFHLANEHFGGWGATIVHLRPTTQRAGNRQENG
jgi:DNA-nicking Smr family endonuclease